MRIVLNLDLILSNIPSEEYLADSSILESTICIRKLKAAVSYGLCEIRITEYTTNQVYLEEFDIWMDPGEYKLVV